MCAFYHTFVFPRTLRVSPRKPIEKSALRPIVRHQPCRRRERTVCHTSGPSVGRHTGHVSTGSAHSPGTRPRRPQPAARRGHVRGSAGLLWKKWLKGESPRCSMTTSSNSPRATQLTRGCARVPEKEARLQGSCCSPRAA